MHSFGHACEDVSYADMFMTYQGAISGGTTTPSTHERLLGLRDDFVTGRVPKPFSGHFMYQ